jgi:hypothetical protein
MKRYPYLIILAVLAFLYIGINVLHADTGANFAWWPIYDISGVGNCAAVTTASQQYTLPKSGMYYYIKAKDANVFILSGSNPTATVTPGTGHGDVVADGERIGPVRLQGTYVAYIGDAAGEICFVPVYK